MNSNQHIWLSPSDVSSGELNFQSFPIGGDKAIRDFEVSIGGYLGGQKYVACTSSGTAAIHLALLMSGVQQGDQVLCQSLTFVASANPIVYLGAIPVFIDSELDTWNMCPIQLERAILQKMREGIKLKAIIVVHIFGMPARMDEIADIAKKYNIVLIEDAAEAMGSSYKNQKCGTFGKFGIYSFNQNKLITTSGGGALMCNTKEEQKQAIFLATQAKDQKAHYEHSQLGFNCRMGTLNAALGINQIERIDVKLKRRRENNLFYRDIFESVNGVSVFSESNSDFFSNHWLSCILIDPFEAGFSKEDLRLWMIERNIETRSVWKPMHLQPLYKDCDYFGGSICQELFETGLCLPSGSNLSTIDKERIKSTVFEFLNSNNLS